MSVGGAGVILTFHSKPAHYIVFDRGKGTVRFGIKEKLFAYMPTKFVEVPFDECEGRFFTNYNVYSFGQCLWIYASYKNTPFFREKWSSTDKILGIWSFIVQFMDKQAPLPDVINFPRAAFKTKGLGTQEEWETRTRGRGFVDPWDVWRGRWRFDPPEAKYEFLDSLEARNQPCDQAPPDGKIPEPPPPPDLGAVTPLPKKVLRPFTYPFNEAIPGRADDKKYSYARSMPSNRYYYLVIWLMFCAGLGLLATAPGPARLLLLGAVLAFAAYFKFRRGHGTILDRENGRVIFHKGLLYRPIRLPFDQCEGRLVRQDHREGFTSYDLHIFHPSHGSLILSTGDTLCLDHALGMWSFVVQYMDKDAPLPDTKPLKSFPDRARGLGPWEKWGAKTIRPGFVDPFAQWLKELADKVEPEKAGDRKTSLRNKPAVQATADPTGQTG